ncbi:UNVERIFIED_CONTAM: type II secretion system F family protein [Halobacillus marinus]
MLSALLRKRKQVRSSDRRLPDHLQILFLHRLSHILSKGYPLLEALRMTGWDARLKPVAESLITALGRGDTIDQAYKHARFSKTVTNFLYFSNIHFDLPHIFRQTKQLMEMKKEYKERITRVLRYPLLLLVFLIGAFTIMKRTVLPNFIQLFEGESTSTLWLLMGVDYFMTGMVIIFLLLGGSLVSLLFILPRMSVQNKLDFYQRFPVLRVYYSYSASYSFTTHLHSLLRAGLTLKQSMETMRDHHGDEVLCTYSKEILLQLGEGKSFGQALHSCPLFRTELTDIFHHTNDVEALQSELEILAEFFIEHIQSKITTWIQRIQPIFFVLVAVVIISIYASIMLPLYGWMNQL